MKLPTDFVAEIEAELAERGGLLSRSARSLSHLVELHERALAVAADLRRPITVVDLLAAANDDGDRRRLGELVRLLRGDGPLAPRAESAREAD